MRVREVFVVDKPEVFLNDKQPHGYTHDGNKKEVKNGNSNMSPKIYHRC